MQQLMAVLPPSSAWALPLPYQRLMLNSNSPLAGMYPKDFQIDKNGKKNNYEGVVLLPFVNEVDLMQGMATVNMDELSEQVRAQTFTGKTHEHSLVCVEALSQ